MQCERAQEYFSDHLERTLDRPMAAALESHLAACRGCREEIEALRDTFFALETAPQVEPPADGAWQVLCRIQAARAEQLEAERARTPGFLAWLRGISPANAAWSAGLATLVVVGSVVLSPVGEHIRNSILGFIFPAPQAAPAVRMPPLQVNYGPVAETERELTLAVAPGKVLPDARVVITGSQTWETAPGPIDRLTTLQVPVRVSTASPGEVMRVTVQSQALNPPLAYWVAAPVAEPRGTHVTLALPDQPVDQALRQLVPYLERPVVVDGFVAGTVDLLMEEQTPRQCLDALAAQLDARVVEEHGVYRITR